MALTVRFADYRLDGDERRLTRGGEDVHLTPKAFDLLCVLVAEAPRVVPKAELHQRLWPQTYVSEATLTGLVKEVRRAIDDPGGCSRVRTVHGVGYAFAADAADQRSPLPAGRHWLLVSGRSIVLVAGENLIGRDTAAAVCLDYAGVSRRHARVTLDARGATIEDLGSKNGTRVGEHVVTGAVRLENGDAIRVGPAVLVYRESADMLSTETHLSTELD
jgi:DNA-binding winged helix-turn-helix (wHTH) protein